jgi:hypothetical protein
MTTHEKIKALIEFEVQWAIDNGTVNDVSHITDYIMSLLTTFSDEGIDKMYNKKFND